MSITQRKDHSYLFRDLSTCPLKLQEDQQGLHCPQGSLATNIPGAGGGGGKQGPGAEKLVIAQPIFIFEKEEQTFKRPAEDTLYEATKHEYNSFSRKRVRSSSFTLHTMDCPSQGVSALSQKRLRSSSFTDLPTFPPSGPVRKNNVFMTPSLVQRNVGMNGTEQGPTKHSEHVLRPATLQPPQSQSCDTGSRTAGPRVPEPCKSRESPKHKISEGNFGLLGKISPTARSSVQLSANQHFLGAASVGCQPNEDKRSFESCSSDFVFGENMVERVVDTQKLTQSQLENDSYAKEKTFKSILKFPINPSYSRTDSAKNMSLIESAAAFSSQPSQRCLLEKIKVLTGEEAEYNVLQINCKIFVFNKTTESWTERGRGTLRLNDTMSSDHGTLQSRLIMRNQGSMRLILNSKLWAQMQIQRANHKNLRITATDLEDDGIKVFLIQASAKDTGYLYAAIHHRLVALRSFSEQKDVSQVESQSETPVLQQISCESCDEEEDNAIQVTKNGSDPSKWSHRQSVACS